MTSLFSPEQLEQIDNYQDRQRSVIDQFNEAMEREDTDTARAIAAYVISFNQEGISLYSAGWQMHCLNWLTAYQLNEWRNSPDDSPEEEAALSQIWDCLWEYKWLVGNLPTDLNESREDLENAVKHMANLYQEFELGRGMVDKAILEQAMLMGDVQAAREAFQNWQTHAQPDHDINDCPACECNTLVNYYHFIGDYHSALSAAQPILQGDLSCGMVPHLSYYAAIDSMIQLGKLDDARTHLEHAITLIGEEGESVLSIMSWLIQLVNQLGDRAWAESLLDDFSEPIVEVVQNLRFDYLQYLFAVAPLNEAALFAAKALAKEFDERNGNRHYQNKLALMFISPTIH